MLSLITELNLCGLHFPNLLEAGLQLPLQAADFFLCNLKLNILFRVCIFFVYIFFAFIYFPIKQYTYIYKNKADLLSANWH